MHHGLARHEPGREPALYLFTLGRRHEIEERRQGPKLRLRVPRHLAICLIRAHKAPVLRRDQPLADIAEGRQQRSLARRLQHAVGDVGQDH